MLNSAYSAYWHETNDGNTWFNVMLYNVWHRKENALLLSLYWWKTDDYCWYLVHFWRSYNFTTNPSLAFVVNNKVNDSPKVLIYLILLRQLWLSQLSDSQLKICDFEPLKSKRKIIALKKRSMMLVVWNDKKTPSVNEIYWLHFLVFRLVTFHMIHWIQGITL